MIRRQRDIDAHNREMDALADRWALRIHAIAFTLTAVVLAMRLVAGRQDLTPGDSWGHSYDSPPAGEVLGSVPNLVTPVVETSNLETSNLETSNLETEPSTESERGPTGDDRHSRGDTAVEAGRAAYVGVR